MDAGNQLSAIITFILGLVLLGGGGTLLVYSVIGITKALKGTPEWGSFGIACVVAAVGVLLFYMGANQWIGLVKGWTSTVPLGAALLMIR